MKYLLCIICITTSLFVAGCLTANLAGSGDPAPVSLFNGKDLTGWKAIDFGGQGEVSVKDGNLILGTGELMTGVVFTGEPPARMNYEISLEAQRVEGDDFFCGLTFPVGTNCVSLIVGGWGGVVTGISSVNYLDASENETTAVLKFDKQRWYAIRVQVIPGRLKVWLDNEEIIDLETTDKQLAVRPGDIELCQPLGICSYQTESAIRKVSMNLLKSSE